MPRSFIIHIHGLDHTVSSRGCQTVPTGSSYWAPHKRLVVHFNQLKPCGDALESSLPADDTSTSGSLYPNPHGQLLAVDSMWWNLKIIQHGANHTKHRHLFPLFPKAIYINDDTLPVIASPLTDSVIRFLSESVNSLGCPL